MDLLQCLTKEPEIILEILLENESGFNIYVDRVSCNGMYEVTNRHPLKHFASSQSQTVKAEHKEIIEFYIPVTRETADCLIKYWEAASHIQWSFELDLQIKSKPFNRVEMFKKTVTYEMFPRLLSSKASTIS
ncbi:hypothetical protein ES703_103921 [subsurface metagenome]